jgi:hypothetical protein
MFLQEMPACCRGHSSVTDNNSVQNLNQTRIDGTENSLNNAKNSVYFTLD